MDEACPQPVLPRMPAALNAGNSAAGNLATQAGLHNAGTNAAQNWFGGAAGANSAAGNLALGRYQGQLNAWQQASQNSASSAAGLGNLIGQLGSAYMMKPVALRRGGIIKRDDVSGSIRGLRSPRAMPAAAYHPGSARIAKKGERSREPVRATSDLVPGDHRRHAAYPLFEWRRVFGTR